MIMTELLKPSYNTAKQCFSHLAADPDGELNTKLI